MLKESEEKLKKLIKYGNQQLNNKGCNSTAETLREVLDNISKLIVTETEDGLYKLNIEQILQGTGCILNISKFKPGSNNNYIVGQVIIGDDTHLYISKI